MDMIRNVFRQKNFMFKLGIVICLLWVVVAILAPLIAPQDPLLQNLDARFQPPSASHWFGTDSLGRDVFSRVLYGSRISITAGLITVLVPSASASCTGRWQAMRAACWTTSSCASAR